MSNEVFVTDLVKSWQQAAANLLNENVLLKASIEGHLRTVAEKDKTHEATAAELEETKAKIETLEADLADTQRTVASVEGHSKVLSKKIDTLQEENRKLQNQLSVKES